MNKFKSLSITASLLLSACATLSAPDLAETEITARDRAIPAEWLLTVNTDGASPARWSQLNNDPILLDYLKTAKAENFDIRIARSRIESAEASLRRAEARLKPRIESGASVSGSTLLGDVDGASESYGLDISARWNPDIFGQTKLSIESSRASLKTQEALSADVTQTLLAATATAYIRAVEAERLVTLAKTNLDFLTESRRISEARYRLGDTAKGDFSFAEANYQSALASYENTQQTARRTKRALSVLLGGFPSEEMRLASTLTVPETLPPRGLPAHVLERRPDIIAARARVASAVINLRQSEKAYWPDIGISGGLSAGSSFSNLFDPGDYVARIGASLSQVIFDGGAIDADIDASKAALDQSLLRYEAALRDAVREISDAFDRAETLQQTLVSLEASSRAANEALRLESIQYDLGESSLLDVLQVQTRVNAIDASLIRARASMIAALIAANQSVAGFLPESL